MKKWKQYLAGLLLVPLLTINILNKPMEVRGEEIVADQENELTEAGSDQKHYTIANNGDRWDGTHYYLADGTLVKNAFFCDGVSTYYLQNDGTPMRNRLTYHPDGTHIIYFDENGHEVFSSFAHVSTSISGAAVDDLCFFDTYGYMYVDTVTYDQSGTALFYANAYGVMERNGWFAYSAANGGGMGYADADGTLMKDTYTYDWNGNFVYIQADGVLYGSGAGTSIGVAHYPVTVSSVSKKGIQGDYAFSGETDVKHVLLNLYMELFVSTTETNYYFDYNGVRYYYNPHIVETYQSRVEEANRKGITVTMVLLMRGNQTCSDMGMMYVPAATDTNRLYALNPYNDAVRAFMGFIVSVLVNPVRHVDNWIIGNEVNTPNAYNYTGTLDLATNANIMAVNFYTLYGFLQNSGVSGARIYLSLDHSWADNDEGRCIAGKDFLTAFWSSMQLIDPNANWNVAYHLYAPIMSKTNSIWKNPSLAARDENARFICASNLDVLTNYIAAHFGYNCRVILSEQGFHVGNGAYGPTIQAAALAYTFYAAQYNNMVDAVIFRSYQDEGTDTPFDLGFKDINGNEREALTVFRYMDTPIAHTVTDRYLEVIGVSNWAEIIPNYNGQW